jgi:hypothetical protein
VDEISRLQSTEVTTSDLLAQRDAVLPSNFFTTSHNCGQQRGWYSRMGDVMLPMFGFRRSKPPQGALVRGVQCYKFAVQTTTTQHSEHCSITLACLYTHQVAIAQLIGRTLAAVESLILHNKSRTQTQTTGQQHSSLWINSLVLKPQCVSRQWAT